MVKRGGEVITLSVISANRVEVKLARSQTPKITGTVGATFSSDQITGAGTQFLTEILPNDNIEILFNTPYFSQTFQVLSIQDNTNLTLTAAQTVASSGGLPAWVNTFNILQLSAADGAKVTVTKFGKVGIGTTAPSEKLEIVNGNIKTNYGISATTGTITTVKISTIAAETDMPAVYVSTNLVVDGGVTASTFNAIGSAYKMNGNSIINSDGSIHAFTNNSAAIIVGTGAAGVNYRITFDGEDNDGNIEWEHDFAANGRFNIDCGMKIERITITDHFHTNELTTHTSAQITVGTHTYVEGNLTVEGEIIASTITASGYIGFASKTVAELETITPDIAGRVFYLTDGANSVNAVVSTGAVICGWDSWGIKGTVWR